MQNLVKSGLLHEDIRPRLGMEARNIAKEDRAITKSRLETKKQKRKSSIPLPNSPFVVLTKHPSFYKWPDVHKVEVGATQEIP